ncbi:MAG: O-antigen ligase family protein [Actinomycetota bacterium]|nr:O-antigen ligase family protein [Actinomycetota bacterium]
MAGDRVTVPPRKSHRRTVGGFALGRSSPSTGSHRLIGQAIQPETGGHALPAWPITGMFVLFPLVWLNGFSSFATQIFGAVCLFLMVVRGRIELPRTWWWWLSYLIWTLATVVMVDSGGRLIGFVQRWTGLFGACMMALYAYNASERLTQRNLVKSLTWMFGWVVAGGYLGILRPHGRLRTLALEIVPAKLQNNSYVLELLSPRFAEVQNPWGASKPFVRPSAPFPYTNGWGDAFVLLLPAVLALALLSRKRMRLLLLGLVLASLPPALATLNRGVFLGAGAILAYLGVRNLYRVRLGHILRAGVVLIFVLIFVVQSGAIDQITHRTTVSSTTSDRADLYRETFERTRESPWFGYGAPRPSQTLQVSVGTQGQLWYVMFSHGFVGLGLFLGAVWGLAWTTRRVRGVVPLLLHSVLVSVSLMLVVYGQDGFHLCIPMICGMVLLNATPGRASPPGATADRRSDGVPPPGDLPRGPSGEPTAGPVPQLSRPVPQPSLPVPQPSRPVPQFAPLPPIGLTAAGMPTAGVPAAGRPAATAPDGAGGPGGLPPIDLPVSELPTIALPVTPPSTPPVAPPIAPPEKGSGPAGRQSPPGGGKNWFATSHAGEDIPTAGDTWYPDRAASAPREHSPGPPTVPRRRTTGAPGDVEQDKSPVRPAQPEKSVRPAQSEQSEQSEQEER